MEDFNKEDFNNNNKEKEEEEKEDFNKEDFKNKEEKEDFNNNNKVEDFKNRYKKLRITQSIDPVNFACTSGSPTTGSLIEISILSINSTLYQT